MNFNNNKITIVEEPICLNIEDERNLWYFDAEKFSLDFPLVCSYLPDNSSLNDNFEFQDLVEYAYGGLTYLNAKFKENYSYLSLLIEHFRRNKNLSVFIIEVKCPDVFYPEFLEAFIFMSKNKKTGEKFEPSHGMWDNKVFYELINSANNVPNRKITLCNLEKINDIFYLRLMVVAELDLDIIRSYFYSNKFLSMSENYGVFPIIQSIATKDWDLVKKYAFFMIRNHTYKKFYINFKIPAQQLNAINCPAFLKHDFVNNGLSNNLFHNLPNDLRGGDLKCVKNCVVFDETPLVPLSEYMYGF